MASPTRALLPRLPRYHLYFRRSSQHVSRCLCTTVPLRSGHNKWSTIKHDKSKNDAAKNREHNLLARDIALASKIGGPNPATNPRLALLIKNAKKSSFAKTSIDSAIARGQGRSPTGAALTSLVLEAVLPPDVGTMIDCLTDSKGRTLQEVRAIMSDLGASTGPAAYMFEKKMRVVFGREERGKSDVGRASNISSREEVIAVASVGEIFEETEGVGESELVLLAPPKSVKALVEVLEADEGMVARQKEIIWQPQEDMKVSVSAESDVEKLCEFADRVLEVSGVQGIYMNVDGGPEEAMDKLRSKVYLGNNLTPISETEDGLYSPAKSRTILSPLDQ